MSPVKIYVGNIAASARNSELKELFEKFGKVVECDILKDYGFVHMEDSNDAKAAIAGLHDTLWKGSRLRVELSTTKTSKGEPSQRYHKPRPPSSPSSSQRRGHHHPSIHSSSHMHQHPPPPPSRSRMMGNGTSGGGPIKDRHSRYQPSSHRSRPYPDVYDRRGPPPPGPPSRGDPYKEMRSMSHDDYYRNIQPRYDYNHYQPPPPPPPPPHRSRYSPYSHQSSGHQLPPPPPPPQHQQQMYGSGGGGPPMHYRYSPPPPPPPPQHHSMQQRRNRYNAPSSGHSSSSRSRQRP